MNLFVNEYKYDEKYLKECTKASVNRYVNPLINRVLLGITFGSGCYCMLNPDRNTILGYILVFATILVSLAIIIRPKLEFNKAKKILAEKGVPMNQIHRNVVTETECIVNDNMENPGHLSLEKVTDYFESENYIYLNFGQKMYIPFKKDGFIAGTCEEFRKFIEKFPRRSEWKPTICSIFFAILALEGIFFALFL